MGLFSFLNKEIAIDLGTANTIIIHNDKIVVDEPSIIALERDSKNVIAIGSKAQLMHGRTHENIRTIRPLRDGVIADFEAAELMIRGLIKMTSKKIGLIKSNLRVVVGIPSGCTEVERRAVKDSSECAGARDVWLIYEPMAAAIGIGIDVEAPEGSMVVDIGGGTTEIAVISLGGIVCNSSIRIAGDNFTKDIREYMRAQHNIRIFEPAAESIKINVGAALQELDSPPADYNVKGPNYMTALPIETPISYKEIAYCIDKSITEIEAAIINVLEQTPSELYTDICKNGIWLTGGGALLRGLDKRLSIKTGLPVKVADDPLHAVARGTGISLKNIDKYTFLMRQ